MHQEIICGQIMSAEYKIEYRRRHFEQRQYLLYQFID